MGCSAQQARKAGYGRDPGVAACHKRTTSRQPLMTLTTVTSREQEFLRPTRLQESGLLKVHGHRHDALILVATLHLPPSSPSCDSTCRH